MEHTSIHIELLFQVSVESETAVFCVGIAHKPLFLDKTGSPAFWALEAHTGEPAHPAVTKCW